MAKWHAYGRCKNRLSKDIGKISSAKVQKKMTGHTVSVAKFLENKGLIDISLAISGLGLKNSKRWSNELGIKNFKLQGRGCLGEKMRRQILIEKKNSFKKTRNIIFIGTDLPDFCHMDLLNTLSKLKKNDLLTEIGFGLDFYLEYFKFSPQIKLSYGLLNLLSKDSTIYTETINNLKKNENEYKSSTKLWSLLMFQKWCENNNY